MPGMAGAETAKTLTPAARRGQPRSEGPTRAPRTASAHALVRARPKEIDISKLEFIGCEAVPMTREQYREFEGRLEVWDAELKTAWIVRDGPMPAHEGPRQQLAGIVGLSPS